MILRTLASYDASSLTVNTVGTLRGLIGIGRRGWGFYNGCDANARTCLMLVGLWQNLTRLPRCC